MRPHADTDSVPPGDGGDLSAESAAWLARRDRGFNAVEAKAFEQWLAGSEARAAEFARIDAVWGELAFAKAVPEIAEMASHLDERTHPARRGALLAWSAGIAAGLVAATVWWNGARIAPAPHASTQMARLVNPADAKATREFTLSDGSVLELRADSEVDVDYSFDSRTAHLQRGEANFVVAKSTARPFLVIAGPVRVRDVGTAFNVQFCPAVVEVLVTEGRVQVEDAAPSRTADPLVPLLVAGQRATIFRDSAGITGRVVVDSPDAAAVSKTLAGESKWIVFDRTPLGTAVEEFNRHSSQRIVLGDASLESRQLGGLFRTDNVEGFVRMLEESMDIKASRRGNEEIVLMPAR
jgi:transmembrane sensor